MKKIIMIAVFAIFLSEISYAQNIGIVAGGGTSVIFTKSDNAEFDKEMNEFQGAITSYLGGFSFENSLIDKQLYLQFGLYAMKKGYGGEEGSWEYAVNLHYFHIPLELKYKFFFDANDTYSFNIGAGGYFGGGFAGNFYDSDMEGEDWDNKVEFGKTEDADMRDMDWGLNFRAEFGLDKFRVGYNYGLGLANANVGAPDLWKDTHRYHQAYVAFYFSNN